MIDFTPVVAMNGVDLGHMYGGSQVAIVSVSVLVVAVLTLIIVSKIANFSTGLRSSVIAGLITSAFSIMTVMGSTYQGQETAINDFESHYRVNFVAETKEGNFQELNGMYNLFHQEDGPTKVTFEDEEGSLHEGYIVFVEERERNSKVFALAVDTEESGDLVEYNEDADVEAEQDLDEVLEQVKP